VVIFVVGLVLSHVVLGLTRSTARADRSMRRSHRLMMWFAVGLVALGLGLGAVGFLAAHGSS